MAVERKLSLIDRSDANEYLQNKFWHVEQLPGTVSHGGVYSAVLGASASSATPISHHIVNTTAAAMPCNHSDT